MMWTRAGLEWRAAVVDFLKYAGGARALPPNNDNDVSFYKLQEKSKRSDS